MDNGSFLPIDSTSGSKRWAISLLSKSNLEFAYNEEVMIDKNTGEIVVKTATGDAISYNYLSRLEGNIMEARHSSSNVGVFGSFYNITFDDRTLPDTLSINQNIMDDTDSLLIEQPVKKMMIFPDIIAVNPVDGEFIQTLRYPKMKVQLKIDDELTDEYTISEFNTHIFRTNASTSVELVKLEIDDKISDRYIFNSLVIVIGMRGV